MLLGSIRLLHRATGEIEVVTEYSWTDKAHRKPRQPEHVTVCSCIFSYNVSCAYETGAEPIIRRLQVPLLLVVAGLGFEPRTSGL